MTRQPRRQTIPAILLAFCALAFSVAAVAGGPEAPAPQIRGFAPSRTAAELALEERFQKVPDPTRAEADLRQLTSEPHVAGTDASRRVAEWIRDQFRADGFDAQIVTYSAYLPVPQEALLEMVAPEKTRLAAPEPPIDRDRNSGDDHLSPAANDYSASGDVTAPVIYVNYGTADDYRMLDSLGISVKGKLVLARYGRGYRGVKAKLAEDHGAAGLIIYSDPGDDGYDSGDVFPEGPWRPMDGIQRGSILYTQVHPGDPLVAENPNGPRIAPSDAAALPHIPAIPISAHDANIVIEHLGKQRVPRGWQGGLPLTYHIGPGEVKLHLKVAMDYEQRPIYNVIAKLKGTSDDEWVILGNHHDAWVYGAADPGSGTSAMLELARGLGELVRGGWAPRRTLIICEWDAEEPGLVGSTDWVDANRAELQAKALAYVNTDVGVTGDAEGSSPASALFAAANEKFTLAPHWWQRVDDEPTRVPHEGHSLGRGFELFPKIAGLFKNESIPGATFCENADGLLMIPENERDRMNRQFVWPCKVFAAAAAASLALAGCGNHNQRAQVPASTPVPVSPGVPGAPSPPLSPPTSTPSGPPPAVERQPAIPGQWVEQGVASWYGPTFDGHRTSNGEIYDMHQFTAAHRTLPFNALVRVTNLNNGMQTQVRINDRGPFVANRVIDLSLSAAQAIQMVGPGTAQVRLEVISGPDPQSGFFGVQVGAFTVRDNAEKFREKLQATYPSVSITPYDSPSGMYYRVRVGRVPTEDAAKQLATQLQTNDQLTTFVVRLDN